MQSSKLIDWHRSLSWMLIFVVMGLGYRPAVAAVEVVQIALAANTGGPIPFFYQVPPAKVFVIEHVMFVDQWDHMGQPKRLTVRHEGSGSSGLTNDTDITFDSAFNTLFRPLKLPVGTAVGLTNLNDENLKVYIYGLLVDDFDFYASSPANISKVEKYAVNDERRLKGTIEIESDALNGVMGETSDNLENWSPNPEVAILPGENKHERRFELFLPTESDSLFVRFSTQYLLRDDYPPLIAGVSFTSSNVVNHARIPNFVSANYSLISD
jgi:hypothetical protein